tara:strand:+ start:61 stop:798 length:738 start_codon:yes stop_codon:yes gene_type:complete
MNLVLDIGNSSVKLYLFENNSIVFQEIFQEEELLNRLYLIDKKNNISNVICSSVTNPLQKNLIEIFKESNVYDLLDKNLKIPFTNNYQSKKTLGQDRIALISSMMRGYANQNNLIIDIGTCITYDFIDSNNVYHGGAISLGVAPRYKGFKNYTSNLPEIEFKEIKKIIGTTTEDSLHIGVLNGIIGEIKEYISNLKTIYKELNVVITGGDSKLLLNKIKNAIFADRDFIAYGLNYIIKYNEAYKK